MVNNQLQHNLVLWLSIINIYLTFVETQKITHKILQLSLYSNTTLSKSEPILTQNTKKKLYTIFASYCTLCPQLLAKWVSCDHHVTTGTFNIHDICTMFASQCNVCLFVCLLFCHMIVTLHNPTYKHVYQL